MRRMPPVIGIRKPAPEAISISRTVTTESLGRLSSFGLSERDFRVTAIQTDITVIFDYKYQPDGSRNF